MNLEVILDLISDRQLQEYVEWLDTYPDSTEEDSLDFLMEILTDSQLDMLLETDAFNATPYANYYGACLTPDGSCIETTMENCRTLNGRFQGPGTSCGGHYAKPVMMSAESVDELPQSGDNSFEKELWVGNDSSQADAAAQNYLLSKYPNKNIIYALSGSSDYNKVLVSWMFVTDEKEYNAPEGKVYRDPAAASDPRLKQDTPPKEVTKYLQQHPEVANLYDDDDASVMVKGIILGCVIGAIGTIFGNLASEMIVDRWKIRPDFVWDKD